MQKETPLPFNRVVAVIDIDGTISDDRHRLDLLPKVHHPKPPQSEYDKYHRFCKMDEPLPGALEFLNAIAIECEIVYLTARPEHYRESTISWLQQHCFPVGCLIMREELNTQGSAKFKRKQLLNLIEGNMCDVRVVVDDREDVLREASLLGLRTMQAENLKQYESNIR